MGLRRGICRSLDTCKRGAEQASIDMKLLAVLIISPASVAFVSGQALVLKILHRHAKVLYLCGGNDVENLRNKGIQHCYHLCVWATHDCRGQAGVA
jgi:hypothetical protein